MIRIKKSIYANGVTILLSLLLVAAVIQAEPNDDLRLTIRIGDVYVYPGEQLVPIPIYIANPIDTIPYFCFNFKIDLDGIGSLQPGVDTVSTLISGWPSVEEFFSTSYFPLARIIAESMPFMPDTVAKYLQPQDGQEPLFWLNANVETIYDTTSNCRGEVRLIYQLEEFEGNDSCRSMGDLFFVRDNHLQPVGYANEYFRDTTYFTCASWDEIDPEQCHSWNMVSGPPYDSIWIGEISVTSVDTNLVNVEQGSLTIVRCGNFNGSADNKINLADITAMIAFVYLNGDEPPVERAANVNGSIDEKINLADITKLIGHVYLGTGPLACE